MASSTKGKLYLIPSPIAEQTIHQVISASVKDEIKHLRHFLVENVTTARRFLGSLKIFQSIEDLNFFVLNKDTTDADLAGAFKSIPEGNDIGVISEAGCPGIADPGATAVRYAHAHDIHVVPLVGPSSIIMALMASGLNGQQFAFHGYLPIDAAAAGKRIKELERESRSRRQTQIFIEAPHRNNSLFKLLCENLEPSTMLSVAVDLTGKNEFVATFAVKSWISRKPQWPKSPAVFLFLA